MLQQGSGDAILRPSERSRDAHENRRLGSLLYLRCARVPWFLPRLVRPGDPVAGGPFGAAARLRVVGQEDGGSDPLGLRASAHRSGTAFRGRQRPAGRQIHAAGNGRFGRYSCRRVGRIRALARFGFFAGFRVVDPAGLRRRIMGTV